jgi:hypothetical protein
MDEIAGPLRRTLDEVGQQGFYGKLLMVRWLDVLPAS